MNTAHHTCFIRNTTTPAQPLMGDDAVSQRIAVEALGAGIDPDKYLKTFDGDRVRLIAIDPDHIFPLVGEIVDFHAQTSWLARWSAAGTYASSSHEARLKHSIRPNNHDALFEAADAVYTGGAAAETGPLADDTGPISVGFTGHKWETPPDAAVVRGSMVDKSWYPNGTAPKHEEVVSSSRPPFSRDGEGIIREVPIPQFLLKDDPRVHLSDEAYDAASVALIRASRDQLERSKSRSPDAPVEDVTVHCSYFLGRHTRGEISTEALTFALGALRAINGEVVVQGDVERVTSDMLVEVLDLLNSGQAKRAIVRVPGWRDERRAA